MGKYKNRKVRDAQKMSIILGNSKQIIYFYGLKYITGY